MSISLSISLNFVYPDMYLQFEVLDAFLAISVQKL